MSFDEDLSDFLNPDEFGEAVTVKSGLNELTINGLLNIEYLINQGVSQRVVSFKFTKSDAPNLKKGDRIILNDTEYSVKDVEPDGESNQFSVAMLEFYRKTI